MEPVVKQISRHHGSLRFHGVAWKSRTWRGEGRQRRPRPHPPAPKCALIWPTQVTYDDQAEDAQGKVASNPYLPCSHCGHYCPDLAYMERIVSADQLEQASHHRVWRCGFRARSALER